MRAEIAVEAARERRRSLLWWALGLAALVGLTVAFYPSLRDDAALGDYAEQLPESLRALFASGALDIASPAGYLNSQIYALMAPLILIVFAIGAGAGAGAVAGEEERGTLDLLLAQPVRRRGYVLQRFLALALLVALLSFALLVAVALGSWTDWAKAWTRWRDGARCPPTTRRSARTRCVTVRLGMAGPSWSRPPL